MVFRTLVLFIVALPLNHVQAQVVAASDLPALVKQINSRYDEQNPILSPDGTTLYFTRANDSLNIGGPKDKGDIWYSRLGDDGLWQKSQNIGRPVNDDLKNYILGFSPDGNIMFLNMEKKNPGGLVINDGVAYSIFENGQWSNPVKVSIDYMFNKSDHQSGSVSTDGNYLLLSLQSYASRGAEDIYICTYDRGKWTQPVNLGSIINTSKQEMTPRLSPDNKKLFFSSNGHGGQGGRDLFVSEKIGADWTTWSKPQNLGQAINSEGAELNWFIDTRNNIAYYSTTQNSDGYGDIRAIVFEQEIADSIPTVVGYEELTVEVVAPENKTRKLSGTIFDKKSKQTMTAAINISANNLNINLSTMPEDGKYTVTIPQVIDVVTFSIKSPGYMGITEVIELPVNDTIVNFNLTPLDIGTTITLNQVYFERGTAQLLDDSYTELNRVVEMLKENPGIKIELAGHTDNQGSSKLNLQLSQERVNVVMKYIVEKGIEGNRIKGKGYGGTRPVASNASEETRKLNRRVEFTILKN